MHTGLSAVTVVIPTYRRPEFVLRQFSYWRESDANVVILDGSPTPIEIPVSLQAPNIRYLHSGASFVERLATAGRHVFTAYCVMLGDDEFFAFSGLRAAIRRLDSDPTILGCVGRCLYFFVDQGRFLLKDAYRQWAPFSEAAVDQAARLEEDLLPRKTHMAHYAVMRAKEWTQIMADAYQKQFSSAYVYERLVNLQRALLGKTEILEHLLWFRSMENRNISVNVEGSPGFLAWALDPKFENEVTEYREIALRIIEKNGIPFEKAVQYERRFFEVGVATTIARKSKFSHRFPISLQRNLLRWSPKRFRLLVKRILPARLLAFSGWEGYDIETICKSLQMRKTNFERADIERVRQLSLETARVRTMNVQY